MNNDLTKSKRVVAGILGGAVIFLALLAFFVTTPLINKIYQGKDEVEIEKMKLHQTEKDLIDLKKYFSLEESIGENKDLIDGAAISKEETVPFIEAIELIGKDSGMDLKISSYVPAKKSKKATTEEGGTEKNSSGNQSSSSSKDSKVYLLVVAKGDYPEFLKFLFHLENMKYNFSVESLEITSKSKSVVSLAQLQEEREAGTIEGNVVISFLPQ